MTLEDVKNRLKATGMPVVYSHWQEKEAPPLPYICYYSNGSHVFYADDKVYYQSNPITIELYTSLKDLRSEMKVERALEEILWTKTETYIDSEKCYQILYEIEV